MSRVLIDGEWYDRLGSNAYWEAEYERVLLQQSAVLFPEFVAVPFKTTVASDVGSARPDLALVDSEYRTWWVVEVELAHHSFGAHVLPQILALRSAEYGETEAAYLANRDKSLDPHRMREVMRGSQPRVLVVVNGPVSWGATLKSLGVLLGFVEMYRSSRDHHVLRVYGEFPSGLGPIVSYCHLDPAIPRLLRVESPARLPKPVAGKYALHLDDSETIWEPVISKDRLWLNPVRTNPLELGVRYVLTSSNDGRLKLQREAIGREDK